MAEETARDGQKKKASFNLEDARALYSFIWRNSRRRQIVTSIVALGTLPLTLAPIELQRRIIDDAIADEDLSMLFNLVAIYAMVIIAQQIVKFTYNMLRGQIAEHLNQRMRDSVIDQSKDGDVDDGSTVAMLTGEVEPVGGFGGDAYAQLVTEGGILITIFAYMLYTEFWLALVAIAAFIPQGLATPVVQDRINEQSSEKVEEIRAVGSDVLDYKNGSDSKRKSAIRRVANILKIRVIIYKLKFGLKAVLNLLDHIADLIVLAVGGYMVIKGQTEIGVVVAFLSGLSQLRSPWRTLISYFRVSSDAQLRFNMLRDKIDITREMKA